MDEYKRIGLELAEKAGELIRNNFVIGMKKEWKEDNSPLTATDKAINNLVIATVKQHFPHHGILGEEGSEMDNNEFIWVCDPIDGTIPFSHGIPTSTFSLALTQDGDVKLGIVYDPYMRRMFIAEKGKGAYLNNKRISVSESPDFDKKVLSVGMWREALYNMREVESKLSEKGAKSLSFACYTYGGMMVACGEFVAAIYGGSNPWDVAAIKVIVEEAGGVCTDMQGGHQRYDKAINGFIASNRLIHPQILVLTRDFATKTDKS